MEEKFIEVKVKEEQMNKDKENKVNKEER